MDKKFKLRFPHVFVLLLGIILICSVLTYFVPAGSYETIVLEDGREVVDPDSYTTMEQTPVSLLGFFSAVPLGLESAASIIFFIFIIGGSFNVLQETGAVEAGLGRLTKMGGRKSVLLVPIIMFAFALAGSCIGMCEETLVFIPIMISLALALGYDSLTGLAIVFLGAMSGFAAAFMNPFNVGVAQGIAGLPIFSGMGLRIVMFTVTTLSGIIFVIIYARKVKANPQLSPMYKFDSERSDTLDLQNLKEFGKREKVVLLIAAASLCLIIFGVIKYGWYLTEIAAIFFAMGIIASIVGGMGLNRYAESLGRGMASIAEGALIVGFAKGILVVLESGNIIDTILFGAATALSSLPAMVTAEGMYVFQSLLSFIIPSGTGQAAVTIPIMTPLADIVGVTRQTMVIGFQMADGVSEILTPTSGWFMAGLSLAKVPYTTWVKWAIPILLIWFLIGGIFVAIGQMISYGPF